MYTKILLLTLALPLTIVSMEHEDDINKAKYTQMDEDKRRSFEQFKKKQDGKNREALKRTRSQQKNKPNSPLKNSSSSLKSSGSLNNSRGPRLTDSGSGK